LQAKRGNYLLTVSTPRMPLTSAWFTIPYKVSCLYTEGPTA
jgi:hypothetical protein